MLRISTDELGDCYASETTNIPLFDGLLAINWQNYDSSTWDSKNFMMNRTLILRITIILDIIMMGSEILFEWVFTNTHSKGFWGKVRNIRKVLPALLVCELGVRTAFFFDYAS